MRAKWMSFLRWQKCSCSASINERQPRKSQLTNNYVVIPHRKDADYAPPYNIFLARLATTQKQTTTTKNERKNNFFLSPQSATHRKYLYSIEHDNSNEISLYYYVLASSASQPSRPVARPATQKQTHESISSTLILLPLVTPISIDVVVSHIYTSEMLSPTFHALVNR